MDVAAVAKIVVGGGRGAGTTTFVRAASEIMPLDCDVAGPIPADSPGPGTMGLDFGRLTVPPGLGLRLFGLPSRPAGRLLWEVGAAGACGAVVLVDAGRAGAATAAVAHVRRLGVPWLVAVNRVVGPPASALRDVAGLLGMGTDVPVVACDPRSRESARACLGVLTGSVRARLEARWASRPHPAPRAGLDVAAVA